jgi:hypothetical protein
MHTCPIGIVEPYVTLKNGRVGMSRWYDTCIFSNTSMEMMLSPAPPSMRVRLTDGDVIDGRHAQERYCAYALSGGQMIVLVEADLASGPLHQAIVGAGLRRRDLSRQLLEVAVRQRSLGSNQEASGKASRLLIAPLVLFPMIIRRWRQW